MSASTLPASMESIVAAGREEHAAMAAELLARAIQGAVDERGVARVALSGGTTPSDTYRALAALALPWAQVEWYQVDERAGDPASPRSNYAAAARDLGLDDGAHGKLFRMESEATDLDAAARAYEALLRRTFGVASAVAFDAVTLGIGDDGHTASLFPGLAVVGIDDRLVAAIPEQPAKKLEARLTLTAPVILEARLAVVIVRGASKSGPVAAARRPGSEEEIPARILHRARGRVVWILDKEAAG
ncbi:MAG: 6-phosphogluconolactonase [Byssovorax sp.]